MQLLFDPVVAKIRELVKQQISATKIESGLDVKVLLYLLALQGSRVLSVARGGLTNARLGNTDYPSGGRFRLLPVSLPEAKILVSCRHRVDQPSTSVS